MAKKYYWLKLKEDFFDDDSIGWIEEQPKGKEYALFYLKLCLKSLKTDGVLIRTVGNMLVPYDMKKLSEITKTDFDTVVVAMELLKNIGLIEILENGEIFLPGLQQMVGVESQWAKYKRKNTELENFQQTSNNSKLENFQSTSNELPKKLQTENRDKEIEIDKENRDNNILARSPNKQDSEPEADVEALLLNDGTEWRPTQALFAEYVRLYPNVDVKQQFNVMRGWCISNPSKCKTRRGITRFVNSWLAREQDKGIQRPPLYNKHQENQAVSAQDSGYDQKLLDRLANESREDVMRRRGGEAHGRPSEDAGKA